METPNPFSDCGQSTPAVTSLATALRVGEEVFRDALQKAPALPKLADVGRAPATLADAIVARDAKEEERRRREAVRKDVKIKGKQVTPLPAVVEQAAPAPSPGLHIGSVNEASAFWMFAEDYFRDVTQEDVMSLMPVALNPEDDDCLTVPFLGRDPRGLDRPAPTKGKQVAVREEEDAVERRGRGRGAGKLELRLSDGPALPAGTGSGFLLQSNFVQHQDALVQGWRPDGRPAATMLDACTDDEAREFCQLAHKLGLLEDADPRGLASDRLPGASAFATMDRAQLDKILMRLTQLGDASATETASASPLSLTGDLANNSQQLAEQSGADGAATIVKPAAAVAGAADDEDTQSSNRGPGVGQELLPRTAGGDYMHPYLRRILERTCTAYVLNPCGGTGSLVESAQDDEDGTAGGGAAPGAGGKGMRGSQAGGSGVHNTKTPAPGKPGYRMTPGNAAHEAALSPYGQFGGEPDGGAGTSLHTAPSGAGMQDMHLDPSQLPPLPPLQQVQNASQDDVALGMLPHTAATPMLGGSVLASGGSSGGSRGGRARNSVNYSALAGKKDKERERELREREREERERAKTVIPRVKRRPGPRGGASWSASGGSAAAALAGLQKPLTNNPIALLNKVPLLFKDEPGSNATTAAVHSIVAEGGPEGNLDLQWTQLDAAADIMAMAPDDEVLAELVALQSELVQQVAINRSRVAALMETVLADLPNQRSVNQQHAEMEEQIRGYLQRKAEVKRNLKREKREMEKRQALAALNEPASPRAVTGRPKKFSSVPAAGFEGMGALVAEGGEPTDAWRGSTPGVSGGEGAPVEGVPVPEDFELVDPLAHRTHDEEALCAICGDGLSVDPNMIVFCERCDIAVHQHCYGVRSIPAEEWLCWPCRMYEESQRAAGVPQSEIRPKRWEMEARGITHAELPGGSLAVSCCLCPVRQGAFKRTMETKGWCHVVCALWHEGPTVMSADAPDTIDNLALIKPERWRSPCTICGKVYGAVAKCNFGHCQCFFHPLCARRAGNYLVARVQPGSKQLRYRIYCHNHSEAQRAKDVQTGAAMRPLEVYTTSAGPGPGPSPNPGPTLGRPSKRGSMGALTGSTTPMEGVEGGFGSAPATAAPTPASPLAPVDMPISEPDAAALAGIVLPVRKKFGRPPKILKQQQLMLQQMQLYQMQQQQQQEQPILSPQVGGPAMPTELQGPSQQPLPSPGANMPSGPQQPTGNPGLGPAPADNTPAVPAPTAVGTPAVPATGIGSCSCSGPPAAAKFAAVSFGHGQAQNGGWRRCKRQRQWQCAWTRVPRWWGRSLWSGGHGNHVLGGRACGNGAPAADDAAAVDDAGANAED
ncbi:hypothetical protein Vretimale_223 [Volvox reticuliferus]|uniref:Uncharacterized protein n=1 Tax=Volvox reticuliferus TaxID=1737510 RepID=A0A8J4G0E7_9CHLO|nr:hypothetical protein Vretimale_223 [Volvox reticuliferus]